MMFIKPKKGLIVMNPATMKPLPEEGANVAGTGHESYWVRVLAADDAEIVEAPQESKAPVSTSTKEPTAKPGAKAEEV